MSESFAHQAWRYLSEREGIDPGNPDHFERTIQLAEQIGGRLIYEPGDSFPRFLAFADNSIWWSSPAQDGVYSREWHTS